MREGRPGALARRIAHHPHWGKVANLNPFGGSDEQAHGTQKRARLSALTVKPGQRAISVARDKIVFTMDEHLGNIWMADSDAR